MNTVETPNGLAQLPMPGMPTMKPPLPSATCCNIAEGQSVVYIGKIGGGPRYGARGVVRSALRRQAVIDIGGSTWHVPYYLLTLPQAA
ncbi:MAG: hypothetical protein IH862_04320 [Chloroflexi bacterium]|nr:hypothetical protein [Chloroflexota bacterium]